MPVHCVVMWGIRRRQAHTRAGSRPDAGTDANIYAVFLMFRSVCRQREMVVGQKLR